MASAPSGTSWIAQAFDTLLIAQALEDAQAIAVRVGHCGLSGTTASTNGSLSRWSSLYGAQTGPYGRIQD